MDRLCARDKGHPMLVKLHGSTDWYEDSQIRHTYEAAASNASVWALSTAFS